jgi:hypothetical protein
LYENSAEDKLSSQFLPYVRTHALSISSSTWLTLLVYPSI